MLTDSTIRTAKPAPRRRFLKLYDGGGLFLLAAQDGSKGWRFRYRRHGREKLLSLGPYPKVSLREARQKAGELREQLNEGRDPSAVRRLEKTTRATTFAAVAKEFMAQREHALRPATKSKHEWCLQKLRKLHDAPVASITPADLLAVLRTIEAKGNRRETAHRCRSFASRVLRYAVATGRATANPADALRGALQPLKVEHHPALTDPKEVGQLLRAIASYSGRGSHNSSEALVPIALAMLPYLAVRPGEFRFATWDEFDLKNATWRIPASRSKMDRPHVVPLSKQVIEYLRFLEVIGSADRLFPGRGDRPISENALRAALSALGYEGRQSAHGFRTTFSTLQNERGVNPDLIELQLAHKSSGVRAVYNRSERLDDRRKMMQEWADYLDELRDDKSGRREKP